MKRTNLTITENGKGKVSIKTDFGVEVLCEEEYKLCKVILVAELRNRTAGLLGTADYEKGNDFHGRNGALIMDAGSFVSDYKIMDQTCGAVYRDNGAVMSATDVKLYCQDLCPRLMTWNNMSLPRCVKRELFLVSIKYVLLTLERLREYGFPPCLLSFCTL